MAHNTDITIDFNNMMGERVGPSGIKVAEVEKLEPTLREIHRGLIDLRKLGQLPFEDLPFQEERLTTVSSRAKEIASHYETVLLLGTGGSSLGAACLLESLQDGDGARVEICQDLHPLTWKRLSESLVPAKTFLIVVSKSGKTIETLAAFLFFRQWMIQALGESGYKKNTLFVTDPRQGPLRKIAEEEKIETFPVPPGVGGRYSVLSTVGLLPAACAGIDIQQILAGARRMDERCKKEEPWINPAMISAGLHYLAMAKRRRGIRVIMPYEERLGAYTEWFAQLWAESLGKLLSLKGEKIRAGSTPVKALGSKDQHSQLQLYLEGPADKTVTLIAAEQSAVDFKIPAAYASHPEFSLLIGKSAHELVTLERRATEAALTQSGCPNMTLWMREISPYAIGQLLYLAEVETVFTGALYEINPFDQPGVEVIKKYIKGLLGAQGFEEYRQAVDQVKKDRRFIV